MSLFQKVFKATKKEKKQAKSALPEIRLNRGYFNVNDVLKDVANILIHDARSKRISIIYRLNKNVPSRMLGDRYKLSNALVEIIGNGIDFTDGRHDISVEIHRNEKNDERNEIHFAVTDRGIGMEQSLVDSVLRPMLNSDDPAEAFGVSGHGLQHARDIIHAMHGSIYMQCNPSDGCRVFFYVNFEFDNRNDRRQYHLDSVEGVGLSTLLIDDDTGSARAARVYLEYFKHSAVVGKIDDLIDAAEYDLVLISSFYWSRDVKNIVASMKKKGTKFVLIENTVMHEKVEQDALNSVDWLLLKPYTQQGIFEMLNGLYILQSTQTEAIVSDDEIEPEYEEEGPVAVDASGDDQVLEKSTASEGTPQQEQRVLSPETMSFLYGKPVDFKSDELSQELFGCLKLSQEVMVASDGLAACKNNIEEYVDKLKEIIWKYVKADKIVHAMLSDGKHEKVKEYCSNMKQDFQSAGLYRMYCLCVLLEKSCMKQQENDMAELANMFSFTLDTTIETIDEFVDHAKYKLGK